MTTLSQNLPATAGRQDALAALLTLLAAPFQGPGNAPVTQTVADTQTHVIGPFTPPLGRDWWLTLNATATASGTAQLLRSTDGGTTRIAVTAGGVPWAIWTFAGASGAIVNEAMDRETDPAATWFLQITLTGGTVACRMA